MALRAIDVENRLFDAGPNQVGMRYAWNKRFGDASVGKINTVINVQNSWVVYRNILIPYLESRTFTKIFLVFLSARGFLDVL